MAMAESAAAAVMWSFAMAGAASGEPRAGRGVNLDAHLVEMRPVELGSKKTVKAFEAWGRTATINVYGRFASADTVFHREALRDAQAMDKMMPGWPQATPAATIELRFHF